MLEDPPREPLPTVRFARSTAGTIVTAALLGIRDALEAVDDEVAQVEEWSGEPPGDDILMRLDPENPADSIVVVRAPRFVSDV